MRNIPEPLRRIAKKILFPVPSHLRVNFTRIDREGLHVIENSIRDNYHTGWRSASNCPEDKHKADLNAHLIGRLEADRREIIPWLDKASTLRNKRILEIGCGTGSSTIALAEQGARITGIDIDKGALRVAKDRSKVYGFDIEFKELNAMEISGAFQAGVFDIIIFFASLEHMTIEERLSSLSKAWQMLPPKGLLVVSETPNRLWYFDSHTSLLPFFHWLPNELAFKYARFSPRENFREFFHTYDAVSKEHFLRQGRGMSFHEFDIAIGSAKDLSIVSSLSTFQGIRYKLKKTRMERRFKSILNCIHPDIHEGFLDDHLYLIIRKDDKKT